MLKISINSRHIEAIPPKLSTKIGKIPKKVKDLHRNIEIVWYHTQDEGIGKMGTKGRLQTGIKN